MSGQNRCVKEVTRGNSGFWWPDTKCLCCYLVSLLAWGINSSCTIPEDLRKQLVLHRTVSYFTPIAAIIIHYILFFNFGTHRNVSLIRGILVLVKGERPGVSGISNTKWTVVQQQHCFLSMCKVTVPPLNLPARHHRPRAWCWKTASPAGKWDLRRVWSWALPRDIIVRLKSPNFHSGALLKTELRSQSDFPHFCSCAISLNQICFLICQFFCPEPGIRAEW